MALLEGLGAGAALLMVGAIIVLGGLVRDRVADRWMSDGMPERWALRRGRLWSAVVITLGLASLWWLLDTFNPATGHIAE